MQGYVGKIEEVALANTNFRQVLFTGTHMQLVVMSLLPGEEIGQEKHDHVDQFFRVEKGTVKIVMDNVESIVEAGMAAVVPSGTTHNVINVGEGAAKIYTIYAPPNHPVNTIHMTKEDASSDEDKRVTV